MRIESRFPKQVVAVLIIGGAVAAYPLSRFGSADVIRSVVAGGLLSTLNVLLGYLAIEYSFGKSYSTFLKTVLGGMGVRMVVVLVILVLLIKVYGYHPVALTASLLAFYTVYLVLEVLFIQRKIVAKNER